MVPLGQKRLNSTGYGTLLVKGIAAGPVAHLLQNKPQLVSDWPMTIDGFGIKHIKDRHNGLGWYEFIRVLWENLIEIGTKRLHC